MRRMMLCLILAAGGCSTAKYRGAEPFVTSFRDDPGGIKDYYYGVNANFVLDEPGARPVASAPEPAVPLPVAATQPAGTTLPGGGP